jgi:hypothetical protein
MGAEGPKGNDGFLKRLKHKLGGGGLKGEKAKNGSDVDRKNDLTAGTSLDDSYPAMSASVMSRDGGKGDGVIR